MSKSGIRDAGISHHKFGIKRLDMDKLTTAILAAISDVLGDCDLDRKMLQLNAWKKFLNAIGDEFSVGLEIANANAGLSAAVDAAPSTTARVAAGADSDPIK